MPVPRTLGITTFVRLPKLAGKRRPAEAGGCDHDDRAARPGRRALTRLVGKEVHWHAVIQVEGTDREGSYMYRLSDANKKAW